MIENLTEIKSQLDIGQTLQAISYHKSAPQVSGNEIRDYCPVLEHGGDKQRSLCINMATKLAWCHSCGFKGDLIELYMKSKGVPFDKAVSLLAEQQGIEVKIHAATRTTMPITPQAVINESSVLGEESHPYLLAKCVEPIPGLYIGKDPRGNHSIIVPYYSVNGELQTIQYVHAGGKYFLNKFPTKGAFFSVGSFKNGDTVYLAEGIATFGTIWMALGNQHPVISFGSANNLMHVARALTEVYPKLKLIFCLDANRAALDQVKKLGRDSRYSYRLPNFEGLTNSADAHKGLADFNDLVSKCGQKIEVVQEQLAKPLSFDELPFDKYLSQKIVSTKEATKTDDKPASFNMEYQEELLSYLLAKGTLDQVMVDGFNPELFDPNIFDPFYRPYLEGIISSWERGESVTIAQISINGAKASPKDYEVLNRISERPVITPKQVEERLNLLSHNKSHSELTALINEASQSNKPLHEKAAALRTGLDTILGGSSILLPQSHHLHWILEEIRNPTHKPLTSGINSLDLLIGGGFKRGELGMLAGGAGSGKTALALQICDSVAANGGIVVYISVEVGVAKLTERSLKRFSYQQKTQKSIRENDISEFQYEKIASNIYLIKGRHGMQVSEIRTIVLSIMRQRKVSDLLLIIDPFQRLGSGNEKNDYGNETMKNNTLCAQIKETAESLGIPILALSDTVKGHKDNKTGEGSIRGSYMGDHTGDYVMMLRTSRNALEAIYGDKTPKKNEIEDPFLEQITKALEREAFKEYGRYGLKGNWDKYASLVTSKVRDSGKFSPLFVYRPAFHLFEDTLLWDDIIMRT